MEGSRTTGLPHKRRVSGTSAIDGKEYTVQYFERAVFELHPENAAPNDVLLSLLGTLAYKEKYPNGAPELPPPANPLAGMTFPETGKEIRGVFLTYWKEHGGLAQQGYPITNPMLEKSELDGKEYTVQYFERAVFEMHPRTNPRTTYCCRNWALSDTSSYIRRPVIATPTITHGSPAN